VCIIWHTACNNLKKTIKICVQNTVNDILNLTSQLPIVIGTGNKNSSRIPSLGWSINLGILDPTAWMVSLWLCTLYGTLPASNK